MKLHSLARVVAVVLSGLAPAQAGDVMTAAEIKQLFTGNTIAGFYVGGGFFSEYHAADGRALGDNGHTLNVDACWNTDGDKVCYHYGQPPDRRTFCFTVEKEGEALKLKVAGSGRLNAAANVLAGNPSKHGDGGRRWSCDDLLSRRDGAPGRGARVAGIPAGGPVIESSQ